jgi:hypothetical protein
MSEVVSVRIKKETKDALERNGVDISLATRAYLEKLAWKSTSKKNLRELHKLIENKVKPSKKGFSLKTIREDRDNVH